MTFKKALWARPVKRYKTTQRAINTTLLIIFAFFLCIMCAALNGCASKLDRAATMANYDNVVKVTNENDLFYETSDAANSLKLSAQMRNKEARDLAHEMATAAGNTLKNE